MSKSVEEAKAEAQEQLDELRKCVEEAKKLPFQEAEKYLGVKKHTDNPITRFLCRRGLHKRKNVSGATVACVRPNCQRILS